MSDADDDSQTDQPDQPAAETDEIALPPLDSLGEDDDYSAFLLTGVSPLLRRQALRQLFCSAKYNAVDGLDDYCEDFTQHVPLGNLVPAELRRRLESALADSQKPLPNEDAHTSGGEPGDTHSPEIHAVQVTKDATASQTNEDKPQDDDGSVA